MKKNDIQFDEIIDISSLGQLRTHVRHFLRMVCMKALCFAGHWQEGLKVETSVHS
jgi:hypothetical protein